MQLNFRQKTLRFQIIPLLSFILLLAACNLPQPDENADLIEAYTTETLAALSTQSAQGQTPVSTEPAAQPQPSATSAPSDTVPPPTPTTTQTQAAPPSNSTSSLVVPVTFKPGGTSAYLQETIAAGEQRTYTVQAAAGQTLLAGAASPGFDVYLDIQGLETGEHLLNANEQHTDWAGKLPASQTYLITLSTTNPDTYFFMGVEIPADIIFEPGEDTIKVEGYLDMHTEWYPGLMTRVRYLVHAAPGREITSIQVSSPNIADLSLGILGQTDGQPYKRFEVSGVGFTGDMPMTQGYYVDVYSLGVSTDFTLEISVK
jgi:hypothetical protein